MLVYVREPHAGEKEFTDVKQPKTLEERRRLAEATRHELSTKVSLVLDGMDDAVRSAYGDLPNSTYLIGRDGRVFFKQAWTQAAALESAIQLLLKMDGMGGPRPPSLESGSSSSSGMIGQTPSGRRLLRTPEIYPVIPSPPAADGGKSIPWFPSLEAAKNLARAHGVPTLVEFYLPGCSYCQAMASESLAAPQVVELSRRMACVKLNVQETAVSALFDELGLAGTPSLAFYGPDGSLLLKHEGFLEADELIPLMYSALEKTRD